MTRSVSAASDGDSSSLPIEELEARLREAEETLEAIRSGEVDAVIVGGPDEQRVYTIENADRPYRVLIEQMQEGAVTLSADGIVLYCNQRFADVLRTPEERVIGSSIFRFVPETERNAFNRLMAGSATGGSKGELVFQAGGGEQLPVYLSLIDLPPDEGERLICGIVTDLTQQKQRSLELADTNRRLASEIEERARAEVELDRFFDISPDLLSIIGTDGRFRRLNPAWEHTLGHSHDTLMATSFLDFVHPDDRDATVRALGSLARGRPVIGAENRCRHKDGSWRWLQWNAQPEGELIYSATRDVTTQRQAEALRREAEESLQIALEASEMGNWDLDLVTNVVRRSARHHEIFGHKGPTPWGPDVFMSQVLPEDREAVAAAFATAVRSGTLETEYRIRRADDGAVRWIRAKGGTYFDDGQAVRMAGVVADITDQRQLEEQLRQAQKMEAVGQLTGGLAHDFNNLLTVILGNLERARARVSDEALARQLDHAREAADRGAGLTQQLLAFSRRQSLQAKVFCVNDLLPGLGMLIRRAIGEEIELQLVEGQGLWHCAVDPNQLESAVLNLSINARDAMPQGGRLRIETANVVVSDVEAAAIPEALPGRYVRVSVVDTGEGMSQEILARVFEPFFTTKDVGKGSGLGLSMVYGFARQSGGHVAIESKVGKGTAIHLHLPWAEPAAAETAPSATGFQPLSAPATVLLVEDDAHVRALVANLVADLGHRVIEAENGPDALALLDGRPDVELLFTDIVMPKAMSGIDLAREARRRRPDLAILLTSGFTSQSLERGPGSDEEFPIIHKPYRHEALADAIGTALSRARDHKAAATQPGRTPEPVATDGASAEAAALRVLVVEDEALISMVLEDILLDLGCQIVGPLAQLGPALEAAKADGFDVALLDVNLGKDRVYPVADALAARAIPFAFMTGHDSQSLPEAYRQAASLSKPYTAEDVERALSKLRG